MTTLPPMLTRWSTLRLAVPLMAANAVAPLAGLVDTAVIGMAGDKTDLGGVALGATVLNVLISSLYFLRMSTTALTAQAVGRADPTQIQLALVRAAGLGIVLGLVLLATRPLINFAGFALLQGEADVEAAGATYVSIRLWSAPAVLAAMAMTGWLIGRRRPGLMLVVTATHSAVNIALDILFVLHWDWGVAGVAWATVIADLAQVSAAFLIVLVLVRRDRAGDVQQARRLDWRAILAPGPLRQLFGVNRDLFIRTVCLIAGMSWFVNAAAGQGAAVLAGTHVLMQFVTVWACVLDAYAFIAESTVGEAVGAKSRAKLKRAVRITSEWAVGSGVLCAGLTLLFGDDVLRQLISDPDARASALEFLPYCAAIPFIGAAAWQLDGIFIGAARGPAMRNAMLATLVLYLAADAVLRPAFGAHGMWAAFLTFYIWRAITLGLGYRAIVRAIPAQTAPA